MKKDDEVKKLQLQIEELTNNWKRALADYQNLEKRVRAEREDFVKLANCSLIVKFLGILDVLEKVQEHLKDKGLELAIVEFKKILEEEGLEEIQAQGQEFNPHEMESVEVTKGENEGKVAEVIFKGYKLNARLLRPAKVKVFKKEINQRDKELAKEQVVQKGDYM